MSGSNRWLIKKSEDGIDPHTAALYEEAKTSPLVAKKFRLEAVKEIKAMTESIY